MRIQITGTGLYAPPKVETAEQWMRTVDTRTEDLLKIRFALEAAGQDR